MNQPYNQFNRSPLSATPVSIGIILVCAIAYLTRFQPLALALWPARHWTRRPAEQAGGPDLDAPSSRLRVRPLRRADLYRDHDLAG